MTEENEDHKFANYPELANILSQKIGEAIPDLMISNYILLAEGIDVETGRMSIIVIGNEGASPIQMSGLIDYGRRWMDTYQEYTMILPHVSHIVSGDEDDEES